MTATNPIPTQPETLLPCPFCGVTLILLGDYDNEKAWNWYGHPSADNSDCLLSQHRVRTKSDLRTPMTVDRKAWNTRAAVTAPWGDRALYSELIHIAAELARGADFLSTCAEDMNPRLRRADILKTAERQELQLKDWANRVRQVADQLSAATSSPTPAQFDLDPLEFWCDLAEVLGHPRPQRVNPASLVAEINERLATAPPKRTRVEGEPLLQRLVDELDHAIKQGYQPNLLDIAEAQRILTATSANSYDNAKSAAEEVLNYLNFDCELDAVKEDVLAAARIVAKQLDEAYANGYYDGLRHGKQLTTISDSARRAAEEVCAYFGDTELAMGGHVNANGVAAIIERHAAASAGSLLSKITIIADISSAGEFGDALERLKSIRQLIDTTTKGDR